MKMNKNSIFILILLIVFSTGCKFSGMKILGKWSNSQNDWIEFFSDNNFISKSFFDIELSGTYSIVDDTRIKLEYEGIVGFVGPQIYTYYIEDDSLTLTSSVGYKTVYKRDS